MLSQLHIENIAVIEETDIEFDKGFNVLTGETGAGKSIVIDAISAVLGERTSRDLIRTGAAFSYVSALFSDVKANRTMEENGFLPDEDGNLLMQREIHRDGKNNCRINGRPATVAQLRALGQTLLNIHGQHDGQLLLDEETHLGYLDAFGGHGGKLEEYSGHYRKLSSILQEMKKLRLDESEKARRTDTLQYQIRELERADLKPGEDEALAERRNLLRNAGKLSDAVEMAFSAMDGAEDRDGIVTMLTDVVAGVKQVHQITGSYEERLEDARALQSAAEDLLEYLRDMREEFNVSPYEMDEVESRLDQLYRLEKKYGATVEDMLVFLDKCRKELESIESSDELLADLERQYKKEEKETRAVARELSELRRDTAKKLESRVQSELAQLDMPKAVFAVEFTEKTCELGLDDTGMDEVRFLMTANVGEDLKPIAKVASGGELARIMLALKNALADVDEIGTMIFDEVDTGVSGRAAQKVAEKMSDIAHGKQVLCVTHLPQLAAMGDVHFSVEKGEKNGRTYTRVMRLDRPARIRELARLTSGESISEITMAGADEMISKAEKYKTEKY